MIIQFFLATTNQNKTKISSSRNLRLTETSVCMVFDSGSFVCPLKKIAMQIKTIVIKPDEATATSRVRNPALKRIFIRNAAEMISMPRRTSRMEYFSNGFNRWLIL